MSASGAACEAVLTIDCVEKRRRPGKLGRIKAALRIGTQQHIGHPNNPDVSIAYMVWTLIF
jgi:hypothetical protein